MVLTFFGGLQHDLHGAQDAKSDHLLSAMHVSQCTRVSRRMCCLDTAAAGLDAAEFGLDVQNDDAFRAWSGYACDRSPFHSKAAVAYVETVH